MKKNEVYVISKNKKALMSTRRFGKVRRLLKSGKAKVVGLKPFTIELLYDTKEYVQPLTLRIDPGKEIGCTVRTENGEVVYAGTLKTRNRSK